jgi:hypothetical protein
MATARGTRVREGAWGALAARDEVIAARECCGVLDDGTPAKWMTE